ncbi:MAG TPA: ABC transporter permease [Mycobacteriales bacterium]|nr:ABC transporter permease [Mycobacteriales bacterium]
MTDRATAVRVPAAGAGTGLSTVAQLQRTGRTALALLRRDYAQRRVIRFAVLLDLCFGMVNLLVFYFISRLLHHPTAQLGGAQNYFGYIAVGLAVTLAVQSAVTEAATQMREERITGTLAQLVSQPVNSAGLALGLVAYPIVFALARSVLYVLVAALGLGLAVGHAAWFGVIVIALLGCAAVVAVGIVLLAITLAIPRSDPVVPLAALALTFLSGAYFPVSVLPGYLQAISDPLPTRLVLEGLRSALFSGGGWEQPAGWLLLTVAVLLPIAVVLFGWATSIAIRLGRLTGV